MSVTITLSGELAGRLQTQAEARKLSLEEWALMVLENVSERPERPETWTEVNARRLTLVRKRYTEGLSDLEESELQSLQDTTARMLEPADRRRLDHVKALVHGRSKPTDE